MEDVCFLDTDKQAYGARERRAEQSFYIVAFLLLNRSLDHLYLGIISGGLRWSPRNSSNLLFRVAQMENGKLHTSKPKWLLRAVEG